MDFPHVTSPLAQGPLACRAGQDSFAEGHSGKAAHKKEIAIEKVFMHRNADSALKLGQARSAALCATFDAAVPVYEYAARQVKQSIVGRGGADKTQI